MERRPGLNHWASQEMHELSIFVLHLDHAGATERACIERCPPEVG